MYKLNHWAFLMLIGLNWQNAYAADEISTALQQTQDCLRNQNCDSATSSAGQAADQKALEVAGGNLANKQELYNISADIMPILIKQTGGDPEKMQALLQKALNDPEGFFNSLPTDDQAKIKNLANSMQK